MTDAKLEIQFKITFSPKVTHTNTINYIMVWSENDTFVNRKNLKSNAIQVMYHPPQNGASTHISFTNNYKSSLKLNWVNHEQGETFYCSLEPNKSYNQ